jgi:hypothetical protein
MSKNAAEWVDLDKLHPWLGNPRHNEAAVPEVMASLRRFGWGAPILARRANGEIVAGHTRWEAARRLGMTPAPVRYLDLTEAEAHALALADNKTNELATWDDAKLASALVGMQSAGVSLDGMGFDESEVAYLTASLDDAGEQIGSLLASTGDDDGDDGEMPGARLGKVKAPPAKPTLTRADVPDAIWPSNNEWGVPVLDLAMQADAFDAPIVRWGRIARTSTMKGTWHFYTEDYCFSALWSDPSKVPATSCVTVVEPNFSTSAQMPRAAALWQVYRKRWLARFWQAKGVRIAVDLNVAAAHADLNMLGVPKGWKAYAIRGYSTNRDFIIQQHEAACERAGTRSLLFMVYGGNPAVRDFARSQGFLWLPEDADAVHKKGAAIGATPEELALSGLDS